MCTACTAQGKGYCFSGAHFQDVKANMPTLSALLVTLALPPPILPKMKYDRKKQLQYL